MIQWIDTKAQGRVYLAPSPAGEAIIAAVMAPESDGSVDFEQVPVLIGYVGTLIEHPVTDERAGIALGVGGATPLLLSYDEARKFIDALEQLLPELSLYKEAWDTMIAEYQGKHRDRH